MATTEEQIAEKDDLGNQEQPKGSNKEELNNGTEALEKVFDGRTIRTVGTGRQDAGGLLDGVSSEDVRQDAQRGDADPDAAAESGGTSGLARGYAAPGNEGVRSTGIHQGGSVRASAGEVSTLTEAETAALLAYKSGGSYQLNAKLREGMELSQQTELPPFT